MHTNKLVELLKTFSKKEFMEFGRLISSPYFNSRSELVRFYDALKKSYPDFNNENFSKENIFRNVYSAKYNDATMRKLSSGMMQLAGMYLSHAAYMENKFEVARNFLSALSKRRLSMIFEIKMKQAEKNLSSSIINSIYHQNNFALLHIKNEHFVITQNYIEKGLKQKEADSIHHFIISRTMELYLQLINYEKTNNHKYDKKMYNEIIRYVGNNIDDYDISIRINYFQIMLLTRESKKDYNNLKELKDKHKDSIDIHLLYNVYVNLTNYCIDMVYEGMSEFRKERYELDKEFVALDLFKQKGYISTNYFITVIENASFYKDYSWAENFIQKNLKDIEPSYIKFAADYCKALLDFSRKKFTEVLAKLAKISTNNPRWRMHINILTLKAHYESGNYEPALMLVDACKHFLRNPDIIPENRRKFYMDFVRYTGKLIEAKANNNKVKLDELKRKITKTGYFREKEWLEAKLNQRINLLNASNQIISNY